MPVFEFETRKLFVEDESFLVVVGDCAFLQELFKGPPIDLGLREYSVVCGELGEESVEQIVCPDTLVLLKILVWNWKLAQAIFDCLTIMQVELLMMLEYGAHQDGL